VASFATFGLLALAGGLVVIATGRRSS